MTGSRQAEYMRLDEYYTEHQIDLTKIRDVLTECEISSVDVDSGDLRLNYADGNVEIIQHGEFTEKISTDNAKEAT